MITLIVSGVTFHYLKVPKEKKKNFHAASTEADIMVYLNHNDILL